MILTNAYTKTDANAIISTATIKAILKLTFNFFSSFSILIPPLNYIIINYIICLGYCDSNTGMSESESDALPLGDTPIYIKFCSHE